MNAIVSAKLPSTPLAQNLVSAKTKAAASTKVEVQVATPVSQDTFTLSDSSKSLQSQATGAKKSAAKLVLPEPKLASTSQWNKERMAKLDQIQLKVQQGRYNIEPFMVDEIALRLARLLVNS